MFGGRVPKCFSSRDLARVVLLPASAAELSAPLAPLGQAVGSGLGRPSVLKGVIPSQLRFVLHFNGNVPDYDRARGMCANAAGTRRVNPL